MNSATVYLNPREVSASRVQSAVDKMGRPDGVLTIEVDQMELENHPEDWGDYSLFVDLFGAAAEQQAAAFARRLAGELGAEVLTEDQLDRLLAAVPSG